jgi:transmembrane 9 superfamily protein 2/4
MVSTILVRTLKKDIARYNRLDQFALEDFGESGDADDTADDSGWKLVHGDVFRPPKNPLLLSVLVGNGAQLFAMTALTIGKLAAFIAMSSTG